MTGSTRLPLWMFPLPDRYPGDLEGQILLRGGAKIRLQKWVDRFTVQFARPVENLAQWVKQFGCELDRELPSIRQIALRVEAAQLESIMVRVRQAAEVSFASHLYGITRDESNRSALEQPILYLTNQIALQFRPQTSAQQMEAITREVGLEVLKLIPGIPKAFVYQLGEGAIANPLKLANRLMQHPDVLLAEPNVAVFASRRFDSQVANDVLPLDLNLGNPTAKKADRSMVVAVIDRAIDIAHPAFEGMGKIVAPLDLTASVSPESDLAESDFSESSESDAAAEGTLCAQVAIGEAFSSAEAGFLASGGIAPGCSLMPITIDPLLDDSAIEQAFDWGLRQGAAVFCWSMGFCWGMTEAGLPPSLRQRAAIHRAAVQGRGGRGCVVLVKSGSEWDDLPDTVSVAIGLPRRDATQRKAIALGIETGIAAKALSVNPDLTAEQVEQILQAVHDQGGQAIGSGSDVPAAVNLAVRLAMRYAAESSTNQIDRTASLQPLEFADRTPREIPDGDEQGMVCSIAVQQTGVISNIEVSLAIAHSFIGDLKIWLISPRGDSILLQDRTLGSLPSLTMSYGLKTTPHLKSLLGRSAEGVWKLRICDEVPGHRGSLKGWQLRLGVQ